MRYVVEEEDFASNDIEDILDYCISQEYHDYDDEYFEEWVNNNYEGATIAGEEYSAYEILSEFGHLYRVESAYQEDMADSDRENARWELRNATLGDQINIQSYVVMVCSNEGEDEDDEDGDCDGDDTVYRHSVSAEITKQLNDLREAIENDKKKIEAQEINRSKTISSYADMFQTLEA